MKAATQQYKQEWTEIPKNNIKTRTEIRGGVRKGKESKGLEGWN